MKSHQKYRSWSKESVQKNLFLCVFSLFSHENAMCLEPTKQVHDVTFLMT